MGPSPEIAGARENAARAPAAAETQRQPGGNPASPGFFEREITRGPSPGIAGNHEAPVPNIIRQVTGGTTLIGLPLPDNGVAVVRGPLLRNPAFAQPSARSSFAPNFARTTFRGRFADRPRRQGHRIEVIGWIGPLFWPYADSDFIDYTFSPYAYDAFWPRAYDDVYDGIFGPYAVGATDDVNEPLSPGSGNPTLSLGSGTLALGGGRPNARLKGEDLALICNERSLGLAVTPIEQIAKVVQPDDSQRTALDDLRGAAERAVGLLRSGCPTELPGTPTGRLAAVRTRLEIMLQAVETVRPALDKFYRSLSDEQKGRFNAIGPEGQTAADAARSPKQDPFLIQACREQVAKIAEVPTARIAEAVRPTREQQAAIDDLSRASMAAAEFLKANCMEEAMLTPPGRLQAMAQRLGSILEAVKTVQPALERFYNMLSDEQKAQFNLLGANRPQASAPPGAPANP